MSIIVPSFAADGPAAAGDPSAAAARLAAVGALLFGPRFQAALANELKVSRPLVCAMVNGQRRITPDVEKRLASIIRSRQIPRLEASIRTLESLAETIELKLEAYAPSRFADAPVEQGLEAGR